jgi:hypothetical protein
MADNDGTNTGLIVIILVLIVALVAVFYFWQQDEGTEDMQLEVNVPGDTSLRDITPAAGEAVRGLAFALELEEDPVRSVHT